MCVCVCFCACVFVAEYEQFQINRSRAAPKVPRHANANQLGRVPRVGLTSNHTFIKPFPLTYMHLKYKRKSFLSCSFSLSAQALDHHISPISCCSRRDSHDISSHCTFGPGRRLRAAVQRLARHRPWRVRQRPSPRGTEPHVAVRAPHCVQQVCVLCRLCSPLWQCAFRPTFPSIYSLEITSSLFPLCMPGCLLCVHVNGCLSMCILPPAALWATCRFLPSLELSTCC